MPAVTQQSSSEGLFPSDVPCRLRIPAWAPQVGNFLPVRDLGGEAVHGFSLSPVRRQSVLRTQLYPSRHSSSSQPRLQMSHSQSAFLPVRAGLNQQTCHIRRAYCDSSSSTTISRLRQASLNSSRLSSLSLQGMSDDEDDSWNAVDKVTQLHASRQLPTEL
jgi:hypothetical protein